jgi:hypothetical protein
MPQPTKLDRLREQRTAAVNAMALAAEAQRKAIEALPETAALSAARDALERAQVAFRREHVASNRRKYRAEVQYEVREIDSYGDALDCWSFPTKSEAMGFARALVERMREGYAAAVERVCDGEYATVWTGGSAEAIAAWNGEFDDDYGDN